VNDATRAAQQAYHPATLRLPVAFGYPLGGIIGRTAIGVALTAVGCAVLFQSGIWWTLGGALPALLGGLAAISNLRALLDADRRKIVLDEHGVEIRYGFSRRHYRFLEYSDYRISRLGLRRFLTALPIELDRSLGEQAGRVRLTLYDRPAFLTPMPMLGGGAPASLLEWQWTLNELRRAAMAAAGLAAELEHDADEAHSEEARRAAIWRAREQAGVRPSRLSRRAYARGRIILGLVFLVLLLAPIGFAVSVKQGIVAICGSAGGSGCLGIDPVLQQIVMIGGPVLAILIFVLGSARMTIRRAHDLDEDLPLWKAAVESLGRYGALERRLNREEGIEGTNRFGPMPPK
jgi:uncharacterized membrane protein YhaH (DUF805 family)